MGKQYEKKMFKTSDHNKPHFHSYVFMLFTTMSTSKKMFFFFRARAEKGIARPIDASSVVWTLVIFYWFVLNMRMQVILDSLFARQGSAPIGGGKKGEFRDWTTSHSDALWAHHAIFSPGMLVPRPSNTLIDCKGTCMYDYKGT